MIGFSVTKMNDFLEAFSLASQTVPRLMKDPVFIVVGNKIDLADERAVSTEEARSRFKSMNPPVPYIETSAKTGENVEAAFELAIRQWRAHCAETNNNSNVQTKKSAMQNPMKSVLHHRVAT